MDSQTAENALLIGIPLLLEYRKTGKLPGDISANSPKDAFGDQPFKLIKTETEFILKSQSQDLLRNVTHEYKFKLPEK